MTTCLHHVGRSSVVATCNFSAGRMYQHVCNTKHSTTKLFFCVDHEGGAWHRHPGRRSLVAGGA
eukprot:5802245-Pyramimonas_sp.AAC.1